MRLVLTRPQDDSERFAPILRAHGHDVLIAPLMRVETIEAALRPHWGAIVITSANAATAIASHPVHAQLVTLPVYAVGKRSADNTVIFLAVLLFRPQGLLGKKGEQ